MTSFNTAITRTLLATGAVVIGFQVWAQRQPSTTIPSSSVSALQYELRELKDVVSTYGSEHRSMMIAQAKMQSQLEFHSNLLDKIASRMDDPTWTPRAVNQDLVLLREHIKSDEQIRSSLRTLMWGAAGTGAGIVVRWIVLYMIRRRRSGPLVST